MSIGRVPGVTGIQPSIVDAKGDLIVATAADSVDRLAVGTNNHVLTADSATATGLKWAAVSAVPTVNWVRLTSGTSWSVPAGIKTATIWCIGGGGGGGSARGDGNKYGGGGGGAGGLQMGTFDLSSVAGSTITYAIGAGGAGGAQNTGTGNAGANGGNTTFGTSGQAWYLSATGGGGGSYASGGCGGGSTGASLSGAAGGGGGGLSESGKHASSTPAVMYVGSGTQGNSGGMGGAGTNGTNAGTGGSGIFINNFGVGGGGHGGFLEGNGYISASTTWGTASPTAGANQANATANTGAGGNGGSNASGNNTGYAGGNGGSGVIFIQYLS